MDNSILFLRRAEAQDENIILEWINDKTSRLNSFNSEEISPQTHRKWFHEILNADDKELFILMNGKTPVGQIRLEVVGDCGTVSYSICERYRGHGYGKTMLQLLENWITIHYEIEFFIIGLVKKNNDISSHIFESVDYDKNENNEYIKYKKKLFPKKRND